MNRLKKAIALAEGMEYFDPSKAQYKKIIAAMQQELRTDTKPKWYRYLFFGKGTSNKFHFFAIFKSELLGGKEDEYIGANAHGRVGVTDVVTEIARGNKAAVQKDVEAKYMKKVKKGYVDVTDELK